MPTKLLVAFISTFLSLTFVDAQSTGAIPPDFKCSDCILVIIKPESNKFLPGFEKHVKKIFNKHYSGKYEIVTAKELEIESRFQDKKIYRFNLNYKIRSEYVSSSRGMNLKHHIRFCVYDRESGKEYPCFAEGRTGNDSIERTAKMLEGTYK